VSIYKPWGASLILVLLVFWFKAQVPCAHISPHKQLEWGGLWGREGCFSDSAPCTQAWASPGSADSQSFSRSDVIFQIWLGLFFLGL
jgi:hypothetical protein